MQDGRAANAKPRPAVREGYAQGAGGVKLAWRVTGEGPSLVCSNGIGVSTIFWDPMAEALSGEYAVVQWDYRGHGRSERLARPGEISVGHCADDLACVMDALRIDRAVLCGHSMGSQVGFEFYRRRPERVAGLVPTLGPYRRAMDTFFDTALTVKVFDALFPLGTRWPGASMALVRPLFLSGAAEWLARRIGIVHPTLCPREMMEPYCRHLTTLDLRTYFTLAADMQRHDAADVLPTIQVPTLIVAGDRDLFCPLHVAHEMHDLIPGAELFVIRDGTHAALCEQPALLAGRLRGFLADRVFRGGSRVASPA